MSVFTKADIEIEHFNERVKPNGEQVTELYKRLEELKSQGIYVVDVTLVSTRSYDSYYSDRTHNQYMIRFVRPKYHVEVTVNRLDDRDYSFHFHRSESLGFFKSAEEVEAIRKEYLAKSTTDVQYIVDIKRFEPLNESI